MQVPSVSPRNTIRMTSLSLPKALVASLLVSLMTVGCSGGSDTGDKCRAALRINLETADGTVIDEVDYEISGNGMTPMSGTIDTSAPGATASVEQFGIPPGEDYVVTMVATSVDGTLVCGGAATFDVGVGVSTQVDVILNCKASEQFGGVRVNGVLNVCAELEKVIVAPLQTSAGYALEVSALGSDAEGDDFEYSWTATGGSFDDPSAAQTIFNCDDASSEEITVEVSDDGFKYCIDSWTVPVDCVGDDGGSGGTAGGGGAAGSAGGGTGGAAGSGGTSGGGGTAGVAGGGGDSGTGGAGGASGSTGGTGGSPPGCQISLTLE
jgi:hypothetical protein